MDTLKLGLILVCIFCTTKVTCTITQHIVYDFADPNILQNDYNGTGKKYFKNKVDE